MIITVTDINANEETYTLNTNDYTTKRESFERKGVSVDFFDGSVKRFEFGKIWKCKVSHESSDTDDFSDLLTGLNNAVLIEVVADYYSGEVVIESASWQNEAEAEGVISENSFEFELRSVKTIGTVVQLDTITIKDGSDSVSLKGVEIQEELQFESIERKLLDSATGKPYYSNNIIAVYGILKISFELSNEYESVAQAIVSSLAKNNSLKASWPSAKFFTVANDLTISLKEAPELINKSFYGIPGFSYNFTFISKALTEEQLGSDITEL